MFQSIRISRGAANCDKRRHDDHDEELDRHNRERHEMLIDLTELVLPG